MADNKQHIHYSLEDIEKYLQGKLSAAAMHELEKAALQDPFLAEAIEGYQQTSIATAKRHLTEIDQQLNGYKEATKVIPLPSSSKRWWNIAAILVLFIGGAALWLSRSSTQKENQPALAVVTPSLQQQEKNILSKDSTGKPEAAEHELTASIEKKKETPKQATERKNINVDKVDHVAAITAEPSHEAIHAMASSTSDTLNTPGTHQPVATSKKQVFTATAMAFRSTQLLADSLRLFKVRVTDENGGPVGNALIHLDELKKDFITDNNGYFSFTTNDSLTNTTISSVGFTNNQVTLSANHINHIVLDENKASLSEIVVTALGKKKENNSSIMPNFKIKSFFMPVGGWDDFKDYVIKKVGSGETELEGDVEFELELDDQGKVKDVAITESPNEKINEKLASAIKDGPRWIHPIKKNKTKAHIKF
ncbi:MAG: carboxypeptidase-like regulatory domain-containing protein [Bacteroidota bacterium]|nr:carboxypeptidase-like regulatory domain-containing protein [Bacteroidota bacterium]